MITLPALVITLLACAGAAVPGLLLAPREGGGLRRFCYACACGLGLVSLLLFALGALQLWSEGALRLIVFALAACGVVYPWLAGLQPPRLPRWSFSGWLAAVLLVALFALTLLPAAAPVTDWDGLSYHLAVPSLYLQHGGFYWIPFIHHSNFPFAAEMLFAPAVAAGVPPAAKVVHWFHYLLASAGAGLLAGRLFGKQCGVWGALAFALMPVALWEAGVAYIDLATAAYTVLSCLALVEAMDGKGARRRLLLLAGSLAGMAAGTKTFSLVWIVLGAVWLGLWLWLEHRKVKELALFLIPSAAVCCPWYLKSLVLTGNPVYPFLFSVFGGKGWDEAGAEMYRQAFTGFGAGRSPADFLLLPWNLLAQGYRFIDGDFLFGSAGPALAALLPAAVLRLKGRATALAAIVLAHTLVWFGLSQQTRYLLPVLALASVIICAAFSKEDLLARAGKLALLVAGGMSVYLAYALAVPVFPLLTRGTTPDSYIQRYVNSLWVVDYLPSDARVLLYGETRGFYLKQEYLWADIGLSTVIPYSSFRSPDEMLRWMKDHGWTVALINRRFAAKDSPAVRLWDRAIEQGLVRPLGGADFSSRMAAGVELWEIP